MYLSNRLKAILDCIPKDTNLLADIGCDHGKLVVAALLQDRCKKAIAADISSESLKKAVTLSRVHNLYDNVEFICGDGFSGISRKLDVAVISGMGGNEIIKILQQENKTDKYILCPHQDVESVRLFLKSNNFYVNKDFVIKDNNKFYSIILAEHGTANYSASEIFLGKNNPQTKFFIERNLKRVDFLNELIGRLQKDGCKINENLLLEYEVLKKWKESER